MLIALPTFFLCVKTNVDYCVVASFVVQLENADAISEALQLIKDWNPTWNPDFFIVDFSGGGGGGGGGGSSSSGITLLQGSQVMLLVPFVDSWIFSIQ